jgi:hypothetical protein
VRSATSTTQREAPSPIVQFRHAFYILGGAALLVFLVEPFLVPDPTPFLVRLTAESLSTLYEQIIPVSGSLLGFYIAAVAILAQLDHGRKIVSELKRGKSFGLLIANMLITILLLFVLTALGVVGAVEAPGRVFIAIYELVLVATLAELALSGFYFAVVTYKVAVYHEAPKAKA